MSVERVTSNGFGAETVRPRLAWSKEVGGLGDPTERDDEAIG